MKKILLSTFVLTAFSLSIILFQISCKKSAEATTSNTTGISQQNKIIFTKSIPVPSSPGEYEGQIWIANYDGTDKQLINITLPSGLFISYTPFVKLSPDQKTIFFSVDDITGKSYSFYSANIDGSNPKLIVPADGEGGSIEVAY